MINYTDISIKYFEEQVDIIYPKVSQIDGTASDIIKKMGRISLSHFANSDSLYFSLSHTFSSAKIGLEILNAICCRTGVLRDDIAINFMASILFCNIGIIKGILDGDHPGNYIISKTDHIKLDPNGTDSILWKYKYYRSCRFIKNIPFLNANTNDEILSHSIGFSDFMDRKSPKLFQPGMIEKHNRATQLITLMASNNHQRTMTEFFYAANEANVMDHNMFLNLGEFKEKWAQHFWDTLYPDVAETILLLRGTDRGRNIVSSIYAHL